MKINLKTAKEIKELKGFGASAAWWSTAVPDEKTARNLAELLYGNSGLKLNIYRYNVGGGYEKDNCRVDNPWRNIESFMDKDGNYDFSKDANAVRMMRCALDTGNVDTLVFFANSPHFIHTHTKQASGGFTEHFSNLRKECYGDFAKYFLDITEHFISEGYPVKYISPINEPQWKWGGEHVWQEGCHYEPEEVRDCLHAFAEELEKRKTPVMLYAPESGCISDHTKEYWNLIKNDELIMKHLGVFAYHSYHDDDNDKSKKDFGEWAENNLGKLRLDMSEWCELPCRHDIDDIGGTLKMIRIIGEDLIFSRAESWTAWVAVNQMGSSPDGKSYSDGLLAATDDFLTYRTAARYRAMAHFSKFISKNAVSLQTGNEKSLGLSSFLFKNTDGRFVLVCTNQSNRTRTVETDKNHSITEIYRTPGSDDFSAEIPEDCHKTYIPPHSAATIIME